VRWGTASFLSKLSFKDVCIKLTTNIYDSNLVNVGFLVTSKIYFKTRNFTQGFEVKAPTS
jgi:hypothetical protein